MIIWGGGGGDVGRGGGGEMGVRMRRGRRRMRWRRAGVSALGGDGLSAGGREGVHFVGGEVVAEMLVFVEGWGRVRGVSIWGGGIGRGGGVAGVVVVGVGVGIEVVEEWREWRDVWWWPAVFADVC